MKKEKNLKKEAALKKEKWLKIYRDALLEAQRFKAETERLLKEAEEKMRRWAENEMK